MSVLDFEILRIDAQDESFTHKLDELRAQLSPSGNVVSPKGKALAVLKEIVPRTAGMIVSAGLPLLHGGALFNAACVMVGHGHYPAMDDSPGCPATLSKTIVTGWLLIVMPRSRSSSLESRTCARICR